jgi:hypothetical protein
MMRLKIGALIACLLVVSSARGQEPDEAYGPKPARGKEVKELYEVNLATNKGNADVLVLPGLVANRKEKTVEVQVESTGLKADDLAEFLLVGHESSHGYEALLWAHAKPSDIQRALIFIGIKPGAPRNPLLPQLSRGGDRVTLTVREKDGESYPIERLIFDKTTEKTLPEDGFIFSGSLRIPAGSKKAGELVADHDELRSVASLYSEPTAVLDVPRRINQGEVYGQQVVNPELVSKGGELLTVVMTPGPSDGKPPPKNLNLVIYTSKGTNGVVCRLSEKEKVLCDEAQIASVIEQVVGFKKESGTPFVHLSFGKELPLEVVSKVAMVMTMMETMDVVAIEPPTGAELYYRAFAPNNEWLKPEMRPCQPWELHLSIANGKVSGSLVWNEPFYSDDGLKQTFKKHEVKVADGQAMQKHLAADAKKRKEAGQSSLPSVLLVYVNGNMSYGELMAFLTPALSTHGTVYVFLPDAGQGGSGQ